MVPDASAASLEGFLGAAVATPAAVATDGWAGYAGLPAEGYAHEPIDPGASGGDAALRLPGIHLVFGLAKRWLLGTHHGAVSPKHLPAYLDEYVFRFNRRTARSISHGFARLVEHAVRIKPTSYRDLVAPPVQGDWVNGSSRGLADEALEVAGVPAGALAAVLFHPARLRRFCSSRRACGGS